MSSGTLSTSTSISSQISSTTFESAITPSESSGYDSTDIESLVDREKELATKVRVETVVTRSELSCHHMTTGSLLWTDQPHLCSVAVPAPPDTHLQQRIQPSGQQHQRLQGEQRLSTVAVGVSLICTRTLIKNSQVLIEMCSGVWAPSIFCLPQVWWKIWRDLCHGQAYFCGWLQKDLLCYDVIIVPECPWVCYWGLCWY